MPVVPQRRTSKTRKRKRRTHYKLHMPGMVVCENCGEMKLSHRVCKSCGHYKGREVVKEKEAEEETVDAESGETKE